MWASLTVHWGFESRDCVSFTFIIPAPSEGFNRRLESFEWMNEKTFKVRSVSWRFVEQRCLGLVREATVSPLHSFLSLCFCSCSAFSAQQILSRLCPELSSGFHLTLRKSQSFTWAPKALGPPDPISSYFWPPAHTAQATRNALLPRHLLATPLPRASVLGSRLPGIFFLDSCMAHSFTSSGLFSDVTFSASPYLNALSPKFWFLSLTSFFLEHLPPLPYYI